MKGSVDDALPPVVLSGSGSFRLGTPQKSEKRTGTPVRSGSVTRSGSNSRSMTFARAIADIQSCKRTLRVVSQRKERRWDNENFIGGPMSLQTTLSPEDAEAYLKHGHNLLLNQTHLNVFGMINESSNSELLSVFLSCKENTYVSNQAKPNKKPIILTPTQQYENNWNKMEKRLKEVLIKTVRSSEILYDFVSNVELLLLFFDTYGVISEDGTVPTALREFIIISIEQTKQQEAVLVLSFQKQIENVSLYRLLVHSVCQFHGLKSQV